MYRDEFDVGKLLSDSAALNVLRFAASIDINIRSSVLEEPAKTAEFARRHRIVGRLLGRFRGTDIPGSAALHEALTELHAEIQSNFDDQMAALGRFVAKFCAGMGVVLLKNQAGYFLTGDATTLRGSGDLDICVTAPNTLCERLGSVVTVTRADARLPPHEFANVVFDEVVFDCHNYMPMWSPTSGIGAPDDFVGMQEDALTARDIMPTARTLENLAPGVFIPSTALSAVISIAAAYIDFVIHCAAHVRRLPGVRASDLLEVAALVRADAFNHREFEAAIERFQLHEALDWFASCLSEVFEDRILHKFGARAPAQSVRRLVAASCLFPFPHDPVRDLTRRPTSSDIILGCAPISYDLATATVLSIPIGQQSGAVIASRKTSVDALSLEFQWSDETVAIRLPLSSSVNSTARIYLEIDGEMLMWDNVGQLDTFSIFAATRPARRAFIDLEADKHFATIRYRRQPDQGGSHRFVVGASVPELPWSAYAGWLTAFEVRPSVESA